MTRNGFTPLRGSAEHGFTLIELLVAMVAGSMLLASLSWTLSSLGRELAASRQAEPRQRLAASAPMLVSLIEQIVPPASDQPVVVAEPRRLAFVTMPPLALGAVGPVRATFSVRADAEGDSLYVRFQSAEGAAAFPASALSDRPLLEHYRRISFEYRMPAANDPRPLPRLVTIRLVDKEGRSTMLAAAPRITAGGDCRFDPVSMTCRR
jgi:prepilin-type N-terminal cleavage/methylation domain-containing protein